MAGREQPARVGGFPCIALVVDISRQRTIGDHIGLGPARKEEPLTIGSRYAPETEADVVERDRLDRVAFSGGC